MMDANRMCHSKHRYWTEFNATKVAAKCTKKRGTALRVYLCPFCLGYHLAKVVQKQGTQPTT